MKTVLLVPGFQEEIDTRDYKSVLKAIESKGYEAKFIPITWARTTIDDWLKELEQVYKGYEPQNTVLAGFSYGSMTAFVAAARRQPAALWLFSFSPYFADDIPLLQKLWLNSIGHRRVSAFSKLQFNELAQCISCQTLIMVGSLEAEKYPLMLRRANIAKQTLSNNHYVMVKNADHDIANKNYILAIKNNI